MIPNYAPIKAIYAAPDAVSYYTLPVVAWTDAGQAAVPRANGSLAVASEIEGFVKLDRDFDSRPTGKTLEDEYGIE